MECGFVYADLAEADVPARLRAFRVLYAVALDETADLRRRPAPEVWSPLEYTCHLRDVFRAQRGRLALALRVDQPAFVSMGRDELVVTGRYNEQDPTVVLGELGEQADALAREFGALGPAELARTGVYPYPEPTVRTVLWVGRHAVHEGEHHLLDIRRMTT